MITKQFLLKVTVESPSTEDAQHDIKSFIRVKNQLGCKVSDSTFTFELCAEFDDNKILAMPMARIS